MNFTTINLKGQAGEVDEFSSDVKGLLLQLLPLMTGQKVAVGLDALLSAYITTASQNAHPGSNQHTADCLRKAADLLEVGAFDQLPTAAGNAVH